MNDPKPRYQVARAHERIEPDARWEKKVWSNVPSLYLSNWMGDLPSHRPATHAKLLYDYTFLYVIFRVEDAYVRCIAGEYQGHVCADSCAELFFMPGVDLADGYFNLETNCGGTVLFQHQLARDERCVAVSAELGGALAVAHTMPRRIDPEISAPTTWCVEYRIPYAALAAYAPVTAPGPGVLWKANFYKCADATSHPHWLTWAKVDWPKPDFHRKEFFGELEFGA
jgi:hypothetical protein